MPRQLPNIFFIVLDTLGAKHMSLYGYPRRTTPNLERIAEECTVYTRCFAPACWTLPSHASMFTGLYPSQHGVHDGNYLLDDRVQHLASVLKMSGYRTMGISSNGLVSPASSLCRDFDHFVDFGASELEAFRHHFQEWLGQENGNGKLQSLLDKGMNTKEQISTLFKYLIQTGNFKDISHKALQAVKNRFNWFSPDSVVMHSSIYTKKTVDIFKRTIEKHCKNNEKPLFLFINFLETHEMYCPPLRWRKFSRPLDKQKMSMFKFYRLRENYQIRSLLDRYCKLYDDEIYYLDNQIRIMWDMWKKSPLAENTIFIITSDHGEHLGEKGLYQHRLSLYNELIWVPLLISLPRGLAQAGTSDRLVSLNDLYATVLDLIHSPLPVPETSQSLLSSGNRDLVLSQYVYPEIYPEFKARQECYKLEGRDFSPPIMAVITAAGMKLLERRDGSLEVYDLRRDMAESHNLISGLSTEALADMRNLLEFLKNETHYPEAVNASRRNRQEINAEI